MTTNKLRIIIGLSLLILIFFIGRCSKECSQDVVNVPIIIPPKEGKFNSPSEFKSIPNPSGSIKITYKDSIVEVPSINQELLDKYLIALKDSEDKDKALELYKEAIKVNQYNNVFDNEDYTLDITTTTQGKLLGLEPKYTRKEQKLNIPITIPKAKEKVFSMNIGAGLTTTKQLDKLDPSIHLDFVTKNGDILSTSYSVDGVIGIKYSVNLFNIKK